MRVGTYASHFLKTLAGFASSRHKLGDREGAIRCWVQVVNICALIGNGYSVENAKGSKSGFGGLRLDRSTCIPWLADAIRYLALYSPQKLVPSTSHRNSQIRLWDAWVEVAQQDATYTPCLEDVLESHINGLFYIGDRLPRSFDVPDSKIRTFKIIPYQKATVDVWRGLAERDPMVYTPHLAKVLKEIVSDHRPRDKEINGDAVDDSYRNEFIDHRRKMMDVWRWVVEQNIVTYGPNLADALELSASDCCQMQRHTEAIRFRREAMDVWRELTQRDNTSYGHRLENSLRHLALDFSQLQDSSDKIAPRYEAVAIWRELTERNASPYGAGDPVRSLYEMGRSLSQLGRHDEALAFYYEAVKARRPQANVNSTTLDYSYFESLRAMSWCLSCLNRDMEAVPWIHECVNGFRKLGLHEELFMALDTQSVVLAQINKFEMAISASQEAVQGFRLLSDLDSHRYHPGLAPILHNLSVHLCSLGQYDQALKSAEESLAIYRTLTSNIPLKCDQYFAGTLRRYAFILEQVGRSEEAAQARDEASEVERGLVPVNEVTDSESDSASQVRLVLYPSEIFHNLCYISCRCPRPKATAR